MKAVVWRGPGDVRVEDVPDPQILNPRDAIVRVTSTTICGSDLHLYGGFIPTMRPGDIIGHECMGEIVEVGPGVKNLSVGDRVVVSAVIACGGCFFCSRGLFSLCDNSNPNAGKAEQVFGFAGAGVMGFSHLFGGYAGCQAELVRVPFADVGCIKIPASRAELPDEKVLFLSDIFPTGYQAAENCDIEPGDTVAVWGAGPVGIFAIKSCLLLGAERVIAIDHVRERLIMAAEAGAEPINFDDTDVYDALRHLTGGRGPDCCLDAVGMEAHGVGLMGLYDRAKQALRLESDRPAVLRQMITCCRKGGKISVIGVYSGVVDKYPIGVAFTKGLTFRTGNVNLQRYAAPLLELILRDAIDPSIVVTHRLPLEDAPRAYRMFRDKTDGMQKVLLLPGQAAGNGSLAAGAAIGAASSR